MDDVDKLLALCYELGLMDGDLDDTVHDLFSSRAAAVNNGGLEDQVEFLIEDAGAEVAAALIRQVAENIQDD